MPKLVKKERTELVQVYVKPENESFLIDECAKQDVSRSLFVDTALDDIRRGRFKPKIVKTIGIVEAARLVKLRRKKDNARRRAKRVT